MWVPMRVLVAGATGVIGRRLIPLLVADGHTVFGTTRTGEGAARLRAQGAEAIVLDVYDRDALVRGAREARPDAVIHQLTDLSAGSSEANAAIRTTGTRALVDAALAAGARRMVAASVSWAYGEGSAPAAESEPLDRAAGLPRSVLLGGVMALEDAVAEIAEPVVLRYGTVYGPGSWYSRDGLMASRAREQALVADDSVTSFVHADDAAAACALALGWPPGTVNICDDEPAPATAWMPVFAEIVGAPAPPRLAGAPPWARGASNRRAREQLGWSPRYPSWREGFSRAL